MSFAGALYVSKTKFPVQGLDGDQMARGVELFLLFGTSKLTGTKT